MKTPISHQKPRIQQRYRIQNTFSVIARHCASSGVAIHKQKVDSSMDRHADKSARDDNQKVDSRKTSEAKFL
ncbi:hypothetical protein [Helicobacter zhangjianzhongii]|uniref:hypothetical protein n=1 Tax=Helicobacter zhangjianzhongii TaxID=2974574 RepID=UPI0025546589|nr:hypothetical protein [Helicobacter sp. CPD2-1]MDL0079401.1 hypothetical protein [Helicobacter sp. CPD2-1]